MPKSEIRSYDDFTYAAGNKEKEGAGSLSPFTFLCTVLIIALLGLIVLYSSSYRLAISQGLEHYWYFFRSFIAAVSGFAVGAILKLLPMKTMRKSWIVLLPLTLIALALSFIPQISHDGWIVIKGIRIIEPASLSLWTFPFIAGGIIRERDEATLRNSLLPGAAIAAIMAASLFSGGLAWFVMMVMILASAVRVKGAGIIGTLLAFIIPAGAGALLCFLLPGKLLSPVSASLSLQPGTALAASAETIRSSQVAGAGLGLGSGLLGGIQDPAGAFIFASYAEELGLIGILALLFLIFLVAILGARTVSRAKERGDIVSAVIVSGIVLSVILRFIISMAYCAGLLPLPGVLLPFFSYAPSEEFIAVMLSVILYRLIHLMGREHEKK